MATLRNDPTSAPCWNGRLPAWVPHAAQHYLAHTEQGLPIRALARQAGCHASTVLRQIRRFETRRDDLLVDAALQSLGRAMLGGGRSERAIGAAKESSRMKKIKAAALPDDETLGAEARRVLRRLCERGAVLAVAPDLDRAVVVREGEAGGGLRTAVVAKPVAEAMALKDWIAASGSGRVVRYRITAAGRAEVARDLCDGADTEEPPVPAEGFAEAPMAFDGPAPSREAAAEDEEARLRRMRHCLTESPLAVLARRRDKSGNPFLPEPLVHAGERLREDFELAQMGPRMAQSWDRFLAPARGGDGSGGTDTSPAEARARVEAAIAELGPGLSDVVLRCCCHLEGLETVEKQLGWSARSAKIVLRIALIRLKGHYDQTIGSGGPMIG